MASATASTKIEVQRLERLPRPFYSPLSLRILAVNALALVMLAGGVLYLDQFRSRLIDQRRQELMTHAQLTATALAELSAAQVGPPMQRAEAIRLVRSFAQTSKAHILLVAHDGRLVLDSVADAGNADPLAVQDRRRTFGPVSAEFLDRLIETVGSFPALEAYAPPTAQTVGRWPETREALAGVAASRLRRLPDTIVVVSVAAPLRLADGDRGAIVMIAGTRDITQVVRDERLSSFHIFLFVLGLTLLTSLFQARTIVRPIRLLAAAAQRVRMGRARGVTLPRFAGRTDEIGHLARALSDMTAALHARMDATEAFAADVAHEIKNPLSSLRSAAESLGRTNDPDLQRQLHAVIQDDVNRLDRLISDISNASRLDAELSRGQFECLDFSALIGAVCDYYRSGRLPRGIHLIDRRPAPGIALVRGLELRLGQVLRNLIDNALSFSPDGGTVRVTLEPSGGDSWQMTVEDDGPGIPAENMADIFKRFYSQRPADETFGQHSGLGLAITRQIVEGHGGVIVAQNRLDGNTICGARLIVRLRRDA